MNTKKLINLSFAKALQCIALLSSPVEPERAPSHPRDSWFSSSHASFFWKDPRDIRKFSLHSHYWTLSRSFCPLSYPVPAANPHSSSSVWTTVALRKPKNGLKSSIMQKLEKSCKRNFFLGGRYTTGETWLQIAEEEEKRGGGGLLMLQ